MLVYGDHSELADPRERLSSIADHLERIRTMPPTIERHSRLVGALIDAGQVQQGAEDAGCEAARLSAFVHRLAGCVVRSWDRNFGDTGQLPIVPQEELPDKVELRLPEGFAFYAVYPEAYAAAASKLRLLARPRVIGIRSIGTTLGAIVAAALGGPPALTARPFGDVFARQVELPADILSPDAHYVIVDEGPGLSGSSFGCVADWLQQRGVPLERIAFVPSHSGQLGPQASEAHRHRWNRAQRVAAEFDPGFLHDAFGNLDELRTGSSFERRKFIGRAAAGPVLLKFAGLGRTGERKLELARALHAVGFTPEPFGLIHGFLVERWYDDARPLVPGDKPINEIGRYIGARARMFPADDASGASAEQLLTMCRRNISLALGESAAAAIEHYDAENLPARVRRVRTDNKLDMVEWLRLPNGRLLKTDALDHHRAHDLIGCQGVEWDVAGAIEEFHLDEAQSRRLVGAMGVPVDGNLVQFYRLAYAAFRLGQSELAGDAAAGERYRRSLHLLLHQDSLARESAGILA